MIRIRVWVILSILLLGGSIAALAQQAAAGTAVVPTLVSFSGVLSDTNGKPLTGITGVTFSLYAEQQGGAPLWLETQNVQPNVSGQYSVTLGATTSSGLPANLFTAGEARWLGVQVQGQAEQPRVMLLSVPYAMKAGDAQTVGGMPASAFVLVAPGGNSGSTPSAPANSGSPDTPALSGTGTTDFLPLWTNSTTLGDSILFQSGTGSTAKVGINNTAPVTTLDVKGNATVRGYLETPAITIATATTGSNSNPMVLVASSFDSSTSKAVTQNFVWQAEPTGNDTTTPSGTLNLLFGAGTATPAETGLKLSNAGVFTFATGQTFPGTGTITGVTAGSDLTGGGVTGNVTLNLDTTQVPLLGAANTFNASQAVNGTVMATTFLGSGSGLTGVNAASLNGLSSSAFSQTVASNTYQSSPLGTAIPQVLAPVNNATTTAGFNSNPLDLAASSYNSVANAAQNELFRWQTEPAGNNSSSPSGTLNLLFGANGASPTETGVNIASNGLVTFASGQTFPGTGTITGITTGSGSGLTGGGNGGNLNLGLTNTCAASQVLQWTGSAWACSTAAGGSVTSVGLSAPSTDFTVSGSPVTSSGTLGLSWTVAPTNADTPNAIVKRDVNGSFNSGPISISNTVANGIAVSGLDTSQGTTGIGVYGASYNTGVSGLGNLYGVYGNGGLGTGVYGDGYTGVYGTGQTGVFGEGGNENGGTGVYGTGQLYGVSGSGAYGVYGFGSWGVYGDGADYGVYGTGDTGVYGIGEGTDDSYGVYGSGITGVLGESASSSGSGGSFSNSTSGDALFTYNQSGGYAAFFYGNVDVDGKLSKAGGSFKIDHPLDPANKYLYHSFVESPDMMNIYNGNVTTDSSGFATITLPDWFEVLNRDFRYQLTVIGQFAQAIVARKIENNRFQIRTSLPLVEVSWQVTGIRQDAWANANRIPVEEEKEASLKGYYLHPQLYGAPAEKGIAWARHPDLMKKLQQDQERMREQKAGLTEPPLIARPARPVPPPMLKKPATVIPPAPMANRVTK